MEAVINSRASAVLSLHPLSKDSLCTAAAWPLLAVFVGFLTLLDHMQGSGSTTPMWPCTQGAVQLSSSLIHLPNRVAWGLSCCVFSVFEPTMLDPGLCDSWRFLFSSCIAVTPSQGCLVVEEDRVFMQGLFDWIKGPSHQDAPPAIPQWEDSPSNESSDD